MKKEHNQSRALYRALNKYGIDNFSFSILEETCQPNEREQFYIRLFDSYHNGYNETLGGDGASYLELPELEVCQYYLNCKSLEKTSKQFNCDRNTVDKILYKHNIQRFSFSESVSFNTTNKKAVAKLNPITQEIIEIYESVAEAERNNNCNKHIQAVCKGKRKTAGGFSWKFI